QRQIQAERFRKQIGDVLNTANVDPTSPAGRGLLELVDELEGTVTDTPTAFSRKARDVGVRMSTRLEELLNSQPAEVATSAPVKDLSTSADLLKGQRSTTYETEIEHQRKVDRTFGGGGLRAITGR